MESKCVAGNLRRDRCHGYDHPSFSSTLLDAIYNSIDESIHDIRPSSRSRSQSRMRGGEEEVLFGEMLLKKQNSSKIGGTSAAATMTKSSSASLDSRSRVGYTEERKSRDLIVDRWMQKTSTIDEDPVIRRRSLPPETKTEFSSLRSSVMTSDRRRSMGSMKVHSSPARSLESSSASRMSSYVDTDFFYGAKQKKSLKPIRTSFSDHRSETFRPLTQPETPLSDEFLYRKNRGADPRPPKSDSAGKSAKSRAMKLYGDLKRMKQPISPGGKLANFLNSLFSASSGSKKQKTSSSPSSAPAAGDRNDAGKWERESKSNFTTNTTPSCSTASSYSRSCLSKRPSSAGRYDSVKRSVRFFPVSVVVDEDLRPCGHKSLRGGSDVLEASTTEISKPSTVDEELKLRMMEKNRKLEEMARDLLRNYHQRRELAARKDLVNVGAEEMIDDDDVESCCSSDLFELEIGVDKYCEELPVYETTRVNTNRAISSRLMS